MCRRRTPPERHRGDERWMRATLSPAAAVLAAGGAASIAAVSSCWRIRCDGRRCDAGAPGARWGEDTAVALERYLQERTARWSRSGKASPNPARHPQVIAEIRGRGKEKKGR